MDIEYCKRTMWKMYEAKMLIDGLKDIKEVKTKSGREAINAIRKKYDI